MATQQELYREILRNSQCNIDGEQVLDTLLAHHADWLSFYPVREAGGEGVTLRDLAAGQHDVDTVYVLCPDRAAAERIVATFHEGADEADIVTERTDSGYVGGAGERVVVRLWWD